MEKKYAFIAIAVVAVLVVASSAVLLMGKGTDGNEKNVVLQSSIAFGGMNNETFDMCIADASGNLYAAGQTDGPVSSITDGYDTTYNGGYSDIIIVKYAPDLSSVVGATYLGGDQADEVWAVAVGNEGQLYVAGWTKSLDFPTTAGEHDGTIERFMVFVAELSPDLKTLQHSVFLCDDSGVENIAVDSSGDVWVVGNTENSDFPATTGAYDTTLFGEEDDAFVVRMSSDLGTIEASTLFGGPGADFCSDIAFDGSGNVYIFGTTFNQWDDGTGSRTVPTTIGAYDGEIGGDTDTYVAKFSSDLTELKACTLLGGSRNDGSIKMLIAKDGNVLVAGSTTSGDFPVTGDAMRPQASFSAVMGEGFLCKLSPDLSELRYSTYLGQGTFSPNSMFEDESGRIYLSIIVSEMDLPPPMVSGAFSSSPAGSIDGYIAILDDKLSKFLYTSYIGGKWRDDSTLALGPDGSIYIAGRTESPDFPTLADSSREQGDGNWFQSDGYVLRFKFE